MSRSISITNILNDLHMQQQDYLHPEEVEARRLASIEYQKKQDGYDTATLPVFAKAALLSMHESQVRRAVVDRLLADWNGARPRLADYRILVERGLAIFNRGKRFHDLTPPGRVAVKKLEWSLCQRFGIHEFIDRPVQYDWRDQYRCTCGSSYLVRRSPTAPGNARRQWAAEHATHDGMAKLTTAMEPVKRAEG